MRGLSLVVTVLLQLTLVFTAEVSQDTVDYGLIDFSIGATTIDPNVYWSIINNQVTDLNGNVQVDNGGGLYVTSISNLIGLNVNLNGNVLNNGTISFNSVGSILPSNYVVTTGIAGALGTFVNNGEFVMASSGALGYGYMTISTGTLTNKGLMIFYDTQNVGGQVVLGGPNIGSGMTNNGQICLYNELYQQQSGIAGTGCITMQANSTTYLHDPLASFSGQTFYLADSASSIISSPTGNIIYSGNPVTVAGYGNGNMVALDVTLNPLNPYSYSTSTGILTLNSITLGSQEFDIGKGYNSQDFAVTTDWDAVSDLAIAPLNAVTYTGPVPNPTKPSICALCDILPSIPGINGTEYTTSTIVTESGTVCTDIEEIIVTTDTNGEFYNSTILLTAECSIPPYTLYTTTFTTTESDGFIETDSGI
ncbi:Hyphally-regulated cell wall protein, partial [Scheffersomyces amazonensis]|uniref:Hyphally-regulated cell wall protein n=1 Tax=Scheffersomyces amazonensis TaxID=1078765 RepID=UPI00315DE838